MIWMFFVGLLVGLTIGGIAIALYPKHTLPLEVIRLIQAVGKYAADPSHENWHELGSAYAQLLEEA